MKLGDWIDTPRFCKVEIERIFESKKEANVEKFTEPTYYNCDPEYDVFGKSLDQYHMIFAAVKK